MKINESNLENNSILNFFTDEINGLGYEQKPANIVSKNLFIKQDLQKILERKENKKNYEEILKTIFNNDKKDFLNHFIRAIEKEQEKFRNKNISFLLQKEFSFKKKNFNLFFIDFENNLNKKRNIYSIVQQLHIEIDNGDNSFYFIPDLTFFVNGMYFSYQELKLNSTGQTAKNQGRLQIIEKHKRGLDLFQSKYSEIKKPEELEKQKKRDLKVFYTPIHISSFDAHEMYVIRSFLPVDFTYNKFKKEFKGKELYNLNKYYPEAVDKILEVPKKNFLNYKEYLRLYFSKENMQRDIIYYNHIESKMILNDKGNQVKSTELSYLVSPYPKQQIAVSKVLNKINEFLEYEDDKFYWEDKLRDLLKELPTDVIEEVLKEQSKYKNNKYINSIILSYAAGFGKTNISGWLALTLKDIETDKGYAYEKIFLISDRLELIEQVEAKLKQMNLDKSMWKKADNKKSFVDSLTDGSRIVIVNIQKFNTIKSALSNKELEKLGNKRTAFIIDEIHRSNSGDQHDEMMSLFSESLSNNKNKNLIIGLTATPKEEDLVRFGEYSGCDGTKPIFTPLDSFTMKEAIDAGFILDFRNNILPISISMNYNIQGNEDLKNKDKKAIYENEERTLNVCHKIVDICLRNTFTKIRGNGKAMVATYSKQAAIKHKEYIELFLAEETEKAEYSKYKDVKVYIVYSNSGSDMNGTIYPDSKRLNNNKSEKEVLNDFKNGKNGIIIVVDKLQTGFNEPKLHTLFLNKEVRDINAIQTGSRINRTEKYKTDCLIVDFSDGNANSKENFPEAISKYYGDQYSKIGFQEPLNRLTTAFNELMRSDIYKRYFKKFEQAKNMDEYLENIEKGIIQYSEENSEETEILLEAIFSYFKMKELLKNIREMDEYGTLPFEIFFKKVMNILYVHSDRHSSPQINVEFNDLNEVVLQDYYKEEAAKKDSDSDKVSISKNDSQTGSNFLDNLLMEESIKEEEIALYRNNLNILFQTIIDMGKENQKDDISFKLVDNNKEPYEFIDLFDKLLRKIGRRKVIDDKFLKQIILFKESVFNDFYLMVLNDNQDNKEKGTREDYFKEVLSLAREFNIDRNELIMIIKMEKNSFVNYLEMNNINNIDDFKKRVKYFVDKYDFL